MDKNSKTLFILLFILAAAMTVVSLYKFVIFKNYDIEYEVDCDSDQGECLIIKEKAGDIPLYE